MKLARYRPRRVSICSRLRTGLRPNKHLSRWHRAGPTVCCNHGYNIRPSFFPFHQNPLLFWMPVNCRIFIAHCSLLFKDKIDTMMTHTICKADAINVLARISQFKERRGWTLWKLAEPSGVDQTANPAWYKKGRSPSVASLEKICEAFGVTISQFFAEENSSVVFTTDQREMMNPWCA